jgi:hypothetical protein
LKNATGQALNVAHITLENEAIDQLNNVESAEDVAASFNAMQEASNLGAAQQALSALAIPDSPTDPSDNPPAASLAGDEPPSAGDDSGSDGDGGADAGSDYLSVTSPNPLLKRSVLHRRPRSDFKLPLYRVSLIISQILEHVFSTKVWQRANTMWANR